MKKAVLVLMLITIISKMSGFLRDVTLSYFYGASMISDAYLISITIPTVIFGIIAAGISTGYIPMYSRIEEQFGEKRGQLFTNNLITVLFVLCTLTIAGALVFTEPIVNVFASGFSGGNLNIAVLLTRITIIGIYFTLVIRILSAYLNYKKLFNVPALIGLPMNAVLILSIIFSYQLDLVIIMGIGYVTALFVQLLLLLYFSFKKGYRYKPAFDLKDTDLKNMLVLAVPVILGSSVTQINKLVDRTLASRIDVGGISALNYAHTVNIAVLGIFVASISTVMYPLISKMAAKGNMDGLKQNVSQSIVGVSLLILPATAGSLFLAEPIISFLYGRGAFEEDAVAMTSDAYFYYSIGLIGFGLRTLLSRTFYSLQDTKTPMINAAIAMVLNIILNFLLARWIGIGGLALATSLSMIFCTLLLFINLRRKIGSFENRYIFLSVIKIAGASAFTGWIAYMAYHQLIAVTGLTLALLLSGVMAAVLYAVLVYFMRINAADDIIKGIKQRLSRR
ncbi:murein biosynthesis integral membrane protein MurJ [Lentibacillus jeotgali]|uniref:murein biosynthesis integral membrane protein MurJ n=1 Tax=Lentibacillus jeotgali TaxID=558169 RepID=UPI0002628833|nr:murein biosynthesis integral membrane protein MurJ [Lentibacillus jeotgali]